MSSIKKQIRITRSHEMDQIESIIIKSMTLVILRFDEAKKLNMYLTKSAYIGSVQFAQSRPRF